jgi:membrane-associated protein
LRTFAPVIAGIVEMDKKKFMAYNILGSILWSFTLIFSGHYLYELFLSQFQIDLKHYIEYIIIFILLITTVPLVIKVLKNKS